MILVLKFINEFPLPAGISVVKSPFVLPVKVEVAVVGFEVRFPVKELV
jgi:hypothetical protein